MKSDEIWNLVKDGGVSMLGISVRMVVVKDVCEGGRKDGGDEDGCEGCDDDPGGGCGGEDGDEGCGENSDKIE